MTREPFPYSSADFRSELERSRHVRFWRVIAIVVAVLVVALVSAIVVLSPF